MNEAGALNTYLIEIFKNHRLTKIFQKEEYEKDRANKFINKLKEISKKKLQGVCQNISNNGIFNWNNDSMSNPDIC